MSLSPTTILLFLWNIKPFFTGKIGGLFIKSSEIGKGIGTQLMDFIENYALSKRLKQVRLYSTKFAFNFYKNRGYKLVKSGY